MDLSYHSLMNDYTVTKKELGETVSDIRRLTGRDPDDFANGSNKFRSTGRTYTGRKRITNTYSGYERKRFREEEKEKSLDKDEYISPEEEESVSSKPSLQSKIVAKHLQVKSRKATIEELNKNDKIKARNRRMFGALMGTLEKFEKEEKKRKVKESMRFEIEKKVEEADTREKERLKKEKESLLITRREKEVKLRILEKKIERAESHEVYDSNCKKMTNFILTKAKPSIFFLPTSHVSATKKCLEDSKMKINELIKKKKEELISDLNEIEDSYKKDSLSGSKDKENDEAKEAESHDVPETETESLVVEQEDSNPEEEELTNDRLLESSLIDQEFEPIYD